MIKKIGVAGAGTMGSGIALVCAKAGFATILFDVNPRVLETAKINIRNSIQLMVEKKRITQEHAGEIDHRLLFTTDLKECVADLFIEAIIEKKDVKIDLFNRLADHNGASVIFATNTSSLSVSKMQAGILHPERVVGMHFFNPAPVMKLVEVVQGEQSDERIIQDIYALCVALGKIPVICKDAPGFIVNRVARHYYLEAMKLVETGVADIEGVDAIMEATGFKMGPFKLMDLIGMDINLAVSESIFESFNQEERFRPSKLQVEKVQKGELGRKSGRGFYTY